MATSMQQFTLEDCKACLSDLLEAFKQPDNAERLEEARDNAGNDMLKTMQMFFPVATQIEVAVIEKYGFRGDGDGIVRFTQAVKHYEQQDPEVAQLNQQLRTTLMPPVQAPTPTQTMAENGAR
ncbi:protein C10-like [Haliotis cracherodii]|uniref:protein C10-like n=1 Tax=Haliotis rufescens TaxID=6454 RepID=UPI001EB0AEC8|nr:protein C10-like [Haliotis rufescens]